MPRLPAIRSRDAIAPLSVRDFLHHTRGSHYYYKHPDKSRLVTVPFHGRDLKRAVVMSIIKQAGMTVEDFRALLQQCSEGSESMKIASCYGSVSAPLWLQ
jgi:predicted RNA binding protein YcfA (HicA-like mRNA interferase family)